MARVGAIVSRSEVSFILKNTFSVGICRWNRPQTSFLGQIGYIYGAFGGKIVPDENFAQFCLKSPLKFVFPKNTFLVWIFVLNHTSPVLWAKLTRWRAIGAKSVPERSFIHPKKHVFGRNFLTKPASYLSSRPNWLHGAFGGKVVPNENFAQFCLKSPLKFVFPKNTFSFWLFILNHTSPIFVVKRTRWHDWGQKCPGVNFRPS